MHEPQRTGRDLIEKFLTILEHKEISPKMAQGVQVDLAGECRAWLHWFDSTSRESKVQEAEREKDQIGFALEAQEFRRTITEFRRTITARDAEIERLKNIVGNDEGCEPNTDWLDLGAFRERRRIRNLLRGVE